MRIDFVVDDLYESMRADAYLARRFKSDVSREEVKKALEQGQLLVNGQKVRPSFAVKNTDIVQGEVTSLRPSHAKPEDIPLDVIFEDSHMLVLNKPTGMIVHPGAGRKSGTLVNALLARFEKLSDLSGADRPGIVHRLDKETSGLLLIAKNNKAHRALQDQFAARLVDKRYLALVHGLVAQDQGHVDAALKRDEKVRTKMSISRDEDAREAYTSYEVLKRFQSASYLNVKIHTGRTHQIRVHMASLGHPVLGDSVYGKKDAVGRLMLHAWRIRFDHPVSGKLMQFECPAPEDFMSILKKIEAPQSQ